MDYLTAQKLFVAKCKQYGVQVTVTRLGVGVLKSYAIFDENKTMDDKTASSTFVSTVNTSSAVAYIGGSFSKPPQPGDALTAKGRDYIVKSVEAYQPGQTVIGFSLELE